MSNERVLAAVFIVFSSVAGYQLMTVGPTTHLRGVPTGSPSAYGPALVDPEPVSHDEVVCVSWTECIDSCKRSEPTRMCYESCTVSTLTEKRFCEVGVDCTCDVDEKSCYTFCNADPT